MRQRLTHFDWGYLAAALLPIIGILPVLGEGILFTADGPIHVHRIFAMSELVQAGNLWPRWIPYFHLGYGYPVFNYYPPLVYHLGSILSLVGISAAAAFTLIMVLSWIAGSIGTYALARKWLSGYAALLAVVLWAYAPMRMHEIYHQGSLPTMLALAFVPWVFWGMVNVTRTPNLRSMLTFALPLAGILLSHQPVAFITGLFLGPALLVATFWEFRHNRTLTFRRVLYVGGAGFLVLGLTAIFLIPLVTELRYIRASRMASDIVPYLRSNYLQPHEIFALFPAHDISDLRGEVPTSLGLVSGVLSVLGIIALLLRKNYRLALVFALATGTLVFMISEVSLPVWLAIPYLAQIRFALRFVSVGTLFFALAGGASLLLLPRSWRPIGLGVASAIVLLTTLPLAYINQAREQWDNLSAKDEIDLELTTHVWGTTSYDEFEPVWGNTTPRGIPPSPDKYIDDPLRIVVNEVDLIRQDSKLEADQIDTATAKIQLTEAQPVRFRQYYFPGWTATLDGEPVEIYPEEDFGLLTIDMPAGEHTVSLQYSGTSTQTISALISLISVGIVGVLGYKVYRSPKTEAEAVSEAPGRRTIAVFTVMVVGFALLDVAYVRPQTRWFRHESPLDAPVYMQTAINQTFGNTITLLGYTLEQDTVTPDGLLNVTLFWHPTRELTEELRPVIQLVNLPMTAAWGAHEPLLLGGNKTPGYTANRFISDPHEFRVFDSAPPYVGRIRVQLRDAATDEFLILPDGSDYVLLEPIIRISGNGQEAVQHLDYVLGDTVELRCASVEEKDDQLVMDLYWHVNGTPTTDLTAFVHGLDANGEIVAQHDSPPIAEYPATYWLPGQNLTSRHTLPVDPAIDRIAIGLYNPADGQRLTITSNGEAVPNNIIQLPLAEDSCLP